MRLVSKKSDQNRFICWRIVLLLSLGGGALVAGSTPTSINLATSGSPSVYGGTVTLTATVSPSAASGKVTFYDETTILGTSVLTEGIATLSTVLLSSGTQSLKAAYLGDSTYALSASASVPQIVNAVAANGFLAPMNYATGTIPGGGAVGDFNGDGIADLLTEATSSFNYPPTHQVQVLFGNGDGTFRTGPVTEVSVTPGSAVVADFNLDGKTDVVISDIGDAAYAVLLGNRDGTFSALPPVSVGEDDNGIPGFAAGDFNEDGVPDLVVAGTGQVFLGHGDGTFSSAGFDYDGVAVVAVADFNGDGHADVATGEQVGVFLGNGDGSLRNGIALPGNITSLSLVTADFNADGKADLAGSTVIYNKTTGKNSSFVYVWLGNGDGTFRNPISFSAGDSGLAVGDFNGDGRPDLISVASSTFSSTPALLLNLGNGDGTFQPAITYPLASWGLSVGYSAAVAVGSFRGDGRTSFVFASYQLGGYYNNQIAVLEGAPTGASTSIVLASSENPAFGGATSGNDSVTFTATVSPGEATGTVIFIDGSTILATEPLINASATFTTANLAEGTHAITAAYGGDSHYPGSVSSVINEQVIPLTVPAPEPAPDPITGNLLINPGAESGMSAWYSSNAQSGSQSGLAHTGTHAFAGVVTPSAAVFITQTVGLSTLSGISLPDIDSGALTANYSFWFAETAPGSGGYGTITLTFLDGSGNRIGEGISPASGGGALTWYNVVGSIAIPSGARSVDYTMDFWGGSGNTGVIDDNVLTISRNALTPNLLTNPGAETGNLTGWYAAYGAPPAAALGTSSYFGAGNENSPHSGRYMFFGGATPNNYLTQTVNLSTVSEITLADVDAGLLTANYSFWYADKNGGTGSLGRITLSFYDGNKNLIVSDAPLEVKGTTVNYGGLTSVSWFNETGTFAIPPNTRSINYTMDFNGTSAQDSGVIDDNALTISRK
jgi:Bacterial Ig-like domain (group 3)/FG-GAP-like repeat